MTISTFGANLASFGTSGSPRDHLITLAVQFKDPATGLPIDPLAPKVRITHEGQPVSVQALGSAENPDHTYGLVASVPPSTGLYRFSFFSANMRPGVHHVEFFGDATISGQSTTLLVKGLIEFGEISVVDRLIVKLRMSLMDDIVQQYQLDAPFHQWNIDQLYSFLEDATSEINAIGPRITNFCLDDFATLPSVLLLDGARVRALFARARFEKANEMSYSDQHSLDIKRANDYFQMANTLDGIWRKTVEGWKKATPPRPIGLKSQRTPFRLSRVIGLLPSYSTFFPG
jgi:hypothetical protein